VIKQLKTPTLIIAAIIICLAMMRLGFWQLDRAEQKRDIQSQSIRVSEMPSVDVASLLEGLQNTALELRFHSVTAKGQYLNEQSILIDNQVLDSRVGYTLLTPFQLTGIKQVVMVDRGWLPVGVSRQNLPNYVTPMGEQNIHGRLNILPAKPPIWNDDYSISAGKVWQFLTVDDFRAETGLDILPLVLELAPAENNDADLVDGQSPIISWQTIDNEWVHKHQAYALQWFSMAAVFLVACIIVLISSLRKPNKDAD